MMNFLCDIPQSKAGPKDRPLHTIPLKELVTTWKNARREHFEELKASGKTYEEIGIMYGITRQAVSRVINDGE